MQVKFTRKADFLQERDFGAKIGATFEFIGAHWRPLGKCLLYFVLPISLLLGVGLGLIINPIWNMMSSAKADRTMTDASAFMPSYFSGMGLLMVGGFLSFVMLMSTVYGYVRTVLILDAPVPPTPTQVWQQVRPRLGRMLLAFLLLGGVYVLVVTASAALAIGTKAGLLLLVLFPGLAYLIVPLALYFPAMWMEDLDVIAALRRCYSLVWQHWWATFGLLFVAAIIQGMLTFVFIVPQYAVMFGKMLKIPFLESDVVGMLAQCLYAAGAMLTYCVVLMAALFQYFNLLERKEGVGMRELVNSLGATTAPSVHNAMLRPDDEGEY